MNIKSIAAGVALSLLSAAAMATTLSTGSDTENQGRSGIYFDLTATNTVTINSFLVNALAGAGNWAVWYKTGTYAGSETNQSAWTLLGTGTTTTASALLDIGGLTISAGTTDGIYIYDYSNYQYYRNGSETISDANLTFTGGTGNYGVFEDSLDFRVFSGAVNYTVTSVPEPGSLALLGLGVAGLLAARRRTRA